MSHMSTIIHICFVRMFSSFLTACTTSCLLMNYLCKVWHVIWQLVCLWQHVWFPVQNSSLITRVCVHCQTAWHHHLRIWVAYPDCAVYAATCVERHRNFCSEKVGIYCIHRHDGLAYSVFLQQATIRSFKGKTRRIECPHIDHKSHCRYMNAKSWVLIKKQVIFMSELSSLGTKGEEI